MKKNLVLALAFVVLATFVVVPVMGAKQEPSANVQANTTVSCVASLANPEAIPASFDVADPNQAQPVNHFCHISICPEIGTRCYNTGGHCPNCTYGNCIADPTCTDLSGSCS